jgi:hypothetical protein
LEGGPAGSAVFNATPSPTFIELNELSSGRYVLAIAPGVESLYERAGGCQSRGAILSRLEGRVARIASCEDIAVAIPADRLDPDRASDESMEARAAVSASIDTPRGGGPGTHSQAAVAPGSLASRVQTRFWWLVLGSVAAIVIALSFRSIAIRRQRRQLVESDSEGVS